MRLTLFYRYYRYSGLATLISILANIGAIIDRLAAKWTEQNIRTKPGIAYEYCHDHPEEYERVAGLNPKFASKYRMDENGKIVKKK